MRWLVVAVLVISAAEYVHLTLHWRLSIDSPVMHYVVYLMRHGLRPYRDISDNNMPGSYLAEAAAMRVFGPGDMAWRVYEFTLLGVLTASLAYLARRQDWVAGIFAGGVFMLIHGTEGPQYAAERELVLATLLAVALAAIFAAVRRSQPAFALICGLASGVAASIKPTFLLMPVVMIVLAAFTLTRQRRPAWQVVAWATLGVLLIVALDVGFLLHTRSFGAFLFILHRVLPTYAGLSPMSFLELTRRALPPPVAVMALLAAGLAIAGKRRQTWTFTPESWERRAILLTALFGLASFYVQRKGFLHHRYTFEIFLLLLIGEDLFETLRRPGWTRWVATACLVILLGWYVPHSVRQTSARFPSSDLELALEHDLTQLGPPAALQRQVMCFDMVLGCLNALYHLDLVENTGFTGDLLFFTPADNAASLYYKDQFRKSQERSPAAIFVVSNQVLLRPDSFDKVKEWPAFADYLHRNYTPVVERLFTWEQDGTHHVTLVDNPKQDGYRIYIRNGSPLLAAAAPLQAENPPGAMILPHPAR